MGFVSDDLSHAELTKTALSVFKVVNELSSHAHQTGWIRHIFKLHSTCYKLIRTSLRSICVSIILSFSVMWKDLASQFLEWFLRWYHLKNEVIFVNTWRQILSTPTTIDHEASSMCLCSFDLVRHWYKCKKIIINIEILVIAWSNYICDDLSYVTYP